MNKDQIVFLFCFFVSRHQHIESSDSLLSCMFNCTYSLVLAYLFTCTPATCININNVIRYRRLLQFNKGCYIAQRSVPDTKRLDPDPNFDFDPSFNPTKTVFTFIFYDMYLLMSAHIFILINKPPSKAHVGILRITIRTQI